ncbi:hypothetical protein C273_02453 [Staphylococcus massiliensis S46]|uniref:Uncharacterized protein n=2 Tax=Staphylococcus massiliensis TaxID=555791 RepID=K9ARM3_9STAP|nr:hypothetical protein C273_02453 [Staphylococcus massiliensis S46]
MYVAGLQYGRAMAMHVSKGAIFGMIGVLCSMLATWGMLATTHMWLLSIVVGFIVWFISAFLLFEIGEKFFRHKHTHHYKH